MVEGFITWSMLQTFASLSFIVFLTVEFLKEIKLFKKIKTKFLACGIAFALMVITNLVGGTFVIYDTLLYALTAILIGMSSNGISDFNKK
jgi:hypothetical protein